MKTTKLVRLTVLLVAVISVMAAAQAAQYSVVDLGEWFAHSVNNAGHVAGNDAVGGVLYRNGTLTHPFVGYVTGINNSGTVIGYDYDVQQTGLVYKRGAISVIESALLFGINSSGQIVGQTPDLRSFLYRNGTQIDLGTLDDGPTFATAINDPGQIVGVSIVYGTVQGTNGPIVTTETRVFLYEHGTMRDLGFNGWPTGINSKGQIVGLLDSGGAVDSFLYERGSLIDLGPINVTGINNGGQIVGSDSRGAIVYSDGAWRILSSLTGVRLDQGVAINESGQIVAIGQVSPVGVPPAIFHSYLLTPINP